MNFLDIFWKKFQIPSFIKIRPVGAQLFHADGQTYITKLIVTIVRRRLKQKDERKSSRLMEDSQELKVLFRAAAFLTTEIQHLFVLE